jgi:hypothetical protein
MKVQRFKDLIEWTRTLHEELAKHLSHHASRHENQRTRWLISYLVERERGIAKLVAGFLDHADEKALATWIYDYTPHEVIDPHTCCDQPYLQMTFDEILATVLGLHNQALELYRYLEARAEIAEAQELLEHLSDMEEHETKLLARQASRIRDL